MNDHEAEVQRDRLTAMLRRWKEPLGLGHWRIRFALHRGDLPPREGDTPGGYGTVLFRVYADWEYMQATIHANLPFVAEHTDEELERHVVHELFHCVVAEMREWAEGNGLPHEERVVTWLTLIAFWLRNGVDSDGPTPSISAHP